MMVRRTIVALLIATAFSAAPALANGWHVESSISNVQTTPAANPKLKSYQVTIKMIEDPGYTPGACTGSAEGYADFCAVGPCDCYTFSGNARGSTGKGPVKFYETFDYGTIIKFHDYGCASVTGEIDISGKKDHEAVAFQGVDCGGLIPNFLSGGCLLGTSDIYLAGQAQCSGPFSGSEPTTFKIEGKVAN